MRFRLKIICLTAIIVSGCTDNNLEQAKKISERRQQELKQFRADFDPLYAKLAACVNSTDQSSRKEADELGKAFGKLSQSSHSLQIYEKVQPLTDHCVFVCQDLDTLFISQTYTHDKSVEEDIYGRLDTLKKDGVSFSKAEAFATVERAKREITTKPIPSEKIKVGARIYDGDTGKPLGMIIKPSEKFGGESVVIVADDPARPDGPSHFYKRHLVELGVDYTVEAQ